MRGVRAMHALSWRAISAEAVPASRLFRAPGRSKAAELLAAIAVEHGRQLLRLVGRDQRFDQLIELAVEDAR